MNGAPAIAPQWPADVVRVSYLAHGVRLHFPALRRWRYALRLALIGGVLFLMSLYAAIAFAPAGGSGAGAMLALVLTSAVVYPVLAFGAWFVLVALYAAGNSLTVEIDPAVIRAQRRWCGIALSERIVDCAAVTGFKVEQATSSRGLGGGTYYRLTAVGAGFPAGTPRAMHVTVADGVPDESLIDAIKALIARCAQLRSAAG